MRSDLDRALTGGVAWTASMSWAVQGIRWVATLVAIRILTPDDYGIVGMATVFTGLVRLVSEFGLGAAIVQRGSSLSEEQVAQLSGLSFLVGALLCAVSTLLSEPVAGFFREPRLPAVITALGFTFLINGFRVAPRSLMKRDLEFKRLAMLDGLEGVVLALGTVVLAFLGLGYWAIVLAVLLSTLAITLGTIASRPHPMHVPYTPSAIRSEIGFGLNVTGASVGWYVYSNADFAVIGRLLGSIRLGEYTVAWSLAGVPIERVTTVIGRVTPSVFAAVKDSPSELARYLTGITSAISLVTFPATFGMAAVASDFVPVVLGEDWLAAVGPLRVLALAAGLRSLGPPVSQILVATNRPHLNMRYSVTCALIFPIAFVVGASFGTVGVGFVWIILYPITAGTMVLRWSLDVTGLDLGRYLRSLWPSSSATVAMLLTVYFVQTMVLDGAPPAARLSGSCLSGAISYSAFLLVFHRKEVDRFRRLLRRGG